MMIFGDTRYQSLDRTVMCEKKRKSSQVQSDVYALDMTAKKAVPVGGVIKSLLIGASPVSVGVRAYSSAGNLNKPLARDVEKSTIRLVPGASSSRAGKQSSLSDLIITLQSKC